MADVARSSTTKSERWLLLTMGLRCPMRSCATSAPHLAGQACRRVSPLRCHTSWLRSFSLVRRAYTTRGMIPGNVSDNSPHERCS